MKKKHLLLSFSAAIFISACGGGSSSPSAGGPTGGTGGTTIAALSVIDANKMPIGNGSVTITSAAGAAVASGTSSSTGSVVVSLPPGSYGISVTKGGASSATIDISTSNTNTNTTAIMPAVLDATGSSMTDVSASAIVASIAGQITSGGAPVADATVSLSSSSAATVASTATDANGYYLLSINVSNTLAGANGVFVGNLRASKTGYNSSTTTGLQVSPGTNVAGLNYALTQASASIAVYSDNFESAASATACGNWTSANSTTATGWHTHATGLGITNAAYSRGLVSLAPDDLSLGKVPDPIGGAKACWYGSAAMGVNTDEQGNFMGSSSTGNSVGSLNGGSSLANSGALVSPAIDLTAVPAGTAVSLSFNTFWEIESVNPNNSGYDIMEIDYSLDSGVTWVALARLNPLSDPSTGAINRAPIPFSNSGYNAAPKWVAQEPIPLVDTTSGASLAGKSIKLRFAFDTIDGLYNGFRGWMIDDVAINKEAGTFPVLSAYDMPVFKSSVKDRQARVQQ